MGEQAGPWTENDRRLARALRLAQSWDCPRCGGDLRIELTDKPPYADDEANHGHHIEPKWCRGCIARIKDSRRMMKWQEKDEGTALDSFPEAQIRIPVPIPIPGREDLFDGRRKLG